MFRPSTCPGNRNRYIRNFRLYCLDIARPPQHFDFNDQPQASDREIKPSLAKSEPPQVLLVFKLTSEVRIQHCKQECLDIRFLVDEPARPDRIPSGSPFLPPPPPKTALCFRENLRNLGCVRDGDHSYFVGQHVEGHYPARRANQLSLSWCRRCQQPLEQLTSPTRIGMLHVP